MAGLFLTTLVLADTSPFTFDTVLDMSYSFCYNASGPYRPDALARLARGKLFIHGMNEMQELSPQYTNSEDKVIAAAKQLKAANPEQLQFYTIQNDFTRSIYNSGTWFNSNPDCLLRDAAGELVNFTTKNDKVPECTQGPNRNTCHVYGFQTQCGRDAWVKYAVDTVARGGLEGVFIDGFQGCLPSGPGLPGTGGNCGRTVGTCTTAQAKAWTDGLGTALWELHRQLKALGNKTIICNGTGQMYACGGATPCFCDAANKERFYPNSNDLLQVVGAAADHNGRNPFWGIIHVPHVNDGVANFNKSLAGFLATAGAAGTPFGYGIGFEYDCEEGGWLRDFPELHKPLGPPSSPPKVTRVNSTGLGAAPGAVVVTRLYTSGVKVFYNSTEHPAHSNSCIEWADSSHTDGNDGCAAMELWSEW